MVEDEPDLITMYRMIFARHSDLKFCVASDVESALQEVQKMRPDLVLLDIIIPVYAGGILEFEKREGFRFLKMVRDNPHRDRAKKLGALEYIVKADYTPMEIVEKALRYLGKKASV
ncbi:MAG: response regulator [Deltaproteobacteria bacterium]|nr:response regulator [Deltaproteobacteria bacterium]